MNDDYDDSSKLLAKNNETIYLDFETNERIDIDSLTVEINGSPLTSTDITNTDTFGKQWRAAFIPTGMSSNVDSVSFQIKSITDTAGNTEDTLTSFNADDSQKTVRIDVKANGEVYRIHRLFQHQIRIMMIMMIHRSCY